MSKPKVTVVAEVYGHAWCVAVYDGNILQGRPIRNVDEQLARALVASVLDAVRIGIDVALARTSRAGINLRAQVAR